MTVRRLMPTNQSRSRISAGCRAVGPRERRSSAMRAFETFVSRLDAADGQLLDQDRRAATKPAGEHETQVVSDGDHLLK
jgi:hypothetical protein